MPIWSLFVWGVRDVIDPSVLDAASSQIAGFASRVLESRKSEILVALGPVERFVVRHLWETIHRELPIGVKGLLAETSTDFGRITGDDILTIAMRAVADMMAKTNEGLAAKGHAEMTDL